MDADRPLTERFTFPVTNPRHVRAVCDPTAPLSAEDQLKLHEDLSPVQGGAKFEQIARRIRYAVGSHHTRELVTGHAGSGKSTELLRLATSLRTPAADGSYFHVVYIDADEYLSPWDLRLPQVILALLAALAQEPRVDLKKTKTASTLVARLKAITKALGGEVAKKFDDITGLPALATALRVNQEMSAEFGAAGLRQRESLLELTRDLVTEVRSQLPPGVVDLAFVIDNLEKIPEQEVASGGSLHETLFVRELPTLDIPAHLVLTYPISLNYDSAELMRAFRGSHRTTLPMVAVGQSPRAKTRGDDRTGMDALTRLLGKRVDLAMFESSDAVDELVRLSGGCVRDLLRMMGELPIVADAPFTIEKVRTAASEFRNDYTRLLQGKPYVKYLPRISETGTIPDEMDSVWQREILLGHVVLEYNSDVWFDVHPLVKATPTYQAAERARTLK
jgi:hypothetical protein